MVKENNINWKILMSGLTFYNLNGFKQIELSWDVDREISNTTKPISAKDFSIDDKVLVASGEQSFIQLMSENKLKNGRYFGITPCFRDEIELDLFHKKYFMKLELINTLEPNKKGLHEMLNAAKEFFSNYLKVKIVNMQENMYDIIDVKTGTELGSYGIRHTEFGDIVYGTGVAEPRLTTVLNLQ